MSSRVQKGGQKFKPVAKPRGRPAESSSALSRNTSSAPETTHITSNTKPLSTVKGPTHNNYRDLKSLSAFPPAPEQSEESSTSTHAIEFVNAVAVPQTQAVNLESTDGRDVAPSGRRPSLSAQGTPAFVASQDFIRSLAVPIATSTRTSPAITHSAQPIAISRPYRSHSVTQSSAPAVSQRELEPSSQSLLQNTYPDNASQLVDDSQILSQVTLVGTQVDALLVGNSSGEPQAGPSMASAPAAQTQHLQSPPEMQRKTRRRKKSSQRETAVADAGGGNDAASGTDHHGSESESRRPQKRRRRSTTVSSSTRTRRSRTSSVPVFDPDADPGEDLDPTVVTMAAICDDTGQGRLSSKAVMIQNNHLAWKTANKEKRARMRSIMEAKKYGRKEDDVEGGETGSSEARKEENAEDNASQVGESSSNPAVDDTSGSGFNYRETLATNRFNAQVRIGPNGETIIDEESLYVDRAENEDDGVDQYQHVEESDQTKFTNSASYGRKLRGSRWSAEETELFYDALSQFGENYELISYVLPGRDRKSCKNKFKAEDRKNSNRITFCLNNRVPYDMQTLSRLTGKDFSGPTPEIRAPEVATLVEVSQDVQAEPEGPPRTTSKATRKKSRTPAADVEVMGDVETFDFGFDS